jgi:hypothetical protein
MKFEFIITDTQRSIKLYPENQYERNILEMYHDGYDELSICKIDKPYQFGHEDEFECLKLFGKKYPEPEPIKKPKKRSKK